MKRSILILLLLCISPAWAQSPSVSPSPVATTKPTPSPSPAVVKEEDPAHADLRTLRTQMQDAMNSNNIEALLTGVTEDVVFSTMNGDVVRGKDAIRDYFAKMMDGPNPVVKTVHTNFEADDLTILYGGSLGEPEDTGVAFGHSTDKYVLANGTEFVVEPRWTATMFREPDGWKVASFHYSVSMFDNPLLAKLKTSMSMVGGVTLAIGLMLGFLFGFVLGRRKR